jgi:hypothetical protein
VAAALLLCGTSLAMAKTRGGSAHAHISAATPQRTVADPYYRLSDQYYGYADPLRGLFDFYAVPPLSPGYTYGHIRPGR